MHTPLIYPWYPLTFQWKLMIHTLRLFMPTCDSQSILFLFRLLSTSQQISDSYNGIINDSPNRTNQSPTNHASRPNSRANNMNQQTNTTTSNSNRQSNNHDGSSPHSPLGSDQMLSGNNYDNLRSMLGSSSPLDGAIMNGINNSNSGVNDIMLGGLGSDSSSKLISSSSPALQNPLLMSTSSPSHQLSQTTAIPEIVFSGENLNPRI